MTRQRARLWLVAAALFTLINLGGAAVAAVAGEVLHTAAHVGLSLLGAYFVWRLAPRARQQEMLASRRPFRASSVFSSRWTTSGSRWSASARRSALPRKSWQNEPTPLRRNRLVIRAPNDSDAHRPNRRRDHDVEPRPAPVPR